MDLKTLKETIVALDPPDFVDQHIVNAACPHVSVMQIEYIRARMQEAVGITIQPSEIHIVGSAKLSFGLFAKRRKNMPDMPAYRPYGPASDVDVAFTSTTLFELIWEELSDYALGKPWMPHRMNKTGDYLVYGWLRPDQIPSQARLRTLDSFKDRIRRLSTTNTLERRKISGALYRNLSCLSKYQARGISQCRQELIGP